MKKSMSKGKEILLLLDAIDSRCDDLLGLLENCDKKNEELLELVIKAAQALTEEEASDETNQATINWDGQEGDLSGTGGVALLEYAKDAIQTAVSNIAGLGTNTLQAKKLAKRKFTA